MPIRLNKFLKDAKQTSHVSGLQLNFSKEYSQSFKTGVFTEHGIIGMLEASDYECMDQISPFSEAITNRMSGNVCEPELKELSTS